VKQQKTATRAHRGTRTASPPPRDKAPRHIVLVGLSGIIIRRCTLPREATYCLNLRDGNYYDRANPTTFVQRSPVKLDFLSVECPTCDAFVGWACGVDHTFPLHRARILMSLATGSAHRESAPVQP
jgi:hypothetical protein